MSFISRSIFGFFSISVLVSACAVTKTTPDTTTVVTTIATAASATTSNSFPIVQGLTNEKATQIAVLVPKSENFKFEAATTQGKIILPESVRFLQIDSSDTKVAQIEFHRLTPGIDYELRVYGENSAAMPRDRRRFSTLDLKPRRHTKQVNVVFASCLYDLFLNESRVMWKAVQSANPDLLLLIGDNVYAEIANGRFPSPLNESALWTRYVETFQALDFFRFERLIPTLATWDDHDYGMKDGNHTNPYKIESKKVFETFFPQRSSRAFPEMKSGPGVSRRWTGFGYTFYFLDNRSFRGEEEYETDGTKIPTHFGIQQEKWLLSGLKTNKNPSFFISGDQWFGAYHRFESYEGRHPKSLKKFFDRIRSDRPGPIALVSGDRHLSEISKIEDSWLGYETYELTSSSLHSKAHPSRWDVSPNPRQVAGIDLKHSFMLLNLSPPEQKQLHLRGAMVGAQSEVLIPIALDIKSLPSRQKSKP